MTTSDPRSVFRFVAFAARGRPLPVPPRGPAPSAPSVAGGGRRPGRGAGGGAAAAPLLSRLPGPRPRRAGSGRWARGGGAGGPPGEGGGRGLPPFPPALRATPPRVGGGDGPRAAPPPPGRGEGGDGSWDDARTGVPPGVPGAQGAFEDRMARWFPRFASRIAFRCVLHPRESRDIRRRELFRGFSFAFAPSRLSRAGGGPPARARSPAPPPGREGGRGAPSGVREGRAPPREGRGLPRFASGSRGAGGPAPACSRCVNDPSAGSPTERLLAAPGGRPPRPPPLAGALPGGRCPPPRSSPATPALPADRLYVKRPRARPPLPLQSVGLLRGGGRIPPL